MARRGFTYMKFAGVRLNPDAFKDSEPSYDVVYSLYESRALRVEARAYVSVKIKAGFCPSARVDKERVFEETLWLSRETYEAAARVFGPSKVCYRAREGVTFTSAQGAWLVVEGPEEVRCPPGVGGKCYRINTRLGVELGIDPFIVEERFIFRGFKGEDVDVGRVTKHRLFLAAYHRNGTPLARSELEKTLLWRNYLSNKRVLETLRRVSAHMKREPWHLERMRPEALAQYKVVWRDVAKEFIAAVVSDGSIPDYTVNYVVVKSPDEAYYLLAILMAPQVNAVVRELSPWIGHVQPRFLRYFKIPEFNEKNRVHVALAQLGKKIAAAGKVVNAHRLQELVDSL